jgi:cytochrome c oxidase subunit 2
MHGKGAMPPQRGGDFTDPELARSVAFMVSAAGANHPEPALPSGHSGWITVPIRQAMAPALATPPAPPYAEMDAQQRRRFGESVYAANCAACHQPSGRGAGTLIPDLANAASLRDPAQAIAIVLQGRGAMPAWRGVLGDEQVAEVLNFMATQFVTAPSTKVTPADVRARREAPR